MPARSCIRKAMDKAIHMTPTEMLQAQRVFTKHLQNLHTRFNVYDIAQSVYITIMEW